MVESVQWGFFDKFFALCHVEKCLSGGFKMNESGGYIGRGERQFGCGAA